ncbi:hypothetical protein SDC9_63588 [bioreactor metagenome]|uniref:PKD domain-containing protein n=1 Tax=bioreactor metagenome TaxID=1076179 RepID=A0A644XLX9_9ZZZZ
MKTKVINIFPLVLFTLMSGMFQKADAQCFAEITTPTADTTICAGQSVFLDAFASCNYLMNNNFNNGTIGTGWSSNANPMYNNPCGPGMTGSGIHCWIGSFTNFPRELVTYPFLLYNGCNISWQMRYAADENTVDCEDPDLAGEGVHLQYSLPPYSTWNDINYWTPNSSYSGPLYVWNQYGESVPSTAFGPATKIRWFQDVTSGNNWDHWGVDEVQIVCPQSQNIFWSNGPTNTLSQTVTPTTTTEYIIAIFDSLGNISTDTVVVNVIPEPSADFDVVSPVCLNQPSTIDFSGSNTGTVAYTYDFDGGTVVSGSGSGPYEVSWSTPGTYTVTLTSTAGPCSNTETRTVVVNSDITVTVSPVSASVCPDSSVTITATGGSTYVWATDPSLDSDSTASVSATPTATTTYYVTGTNIQGCTGSASATVSLYSAPSIAITPVPGNGCTPLPVDFNPDVSPGATSYLWDFGDAGSGYQNSSTQQSPVHVYHNAGSYDVTLNVISNQGCPGSATFHSLVTTYDVPVAAFLADSSTLNMMNPTVGFTDMSTGALNWYWDFGEPGSYSNYSNQSNPFHTYGSTGEYIVWMIVDNGYCSDSAYTIISVIQDIAFYMPSAFSPFNEDGVNDVFGPSGIGAGLGDNTFSMRIYDRWGKLVFESKDFFTGWDGKYNGAFVQPGVYTYFVEVQYADKLWRKFWGKVTLVE